MILFPDCKINLGLYVTQKRADGYHDIETIFYPVKIFDALEIVPAEKAALHLSGIAVAGEKEKNLVWKAYSILKQQYPAQVGEANIYLNKTIPMGAGLGGGSADGAFALILLNEFYKLGLSKDELAKIALTLGSDCPFFIYNTPQYAQGRGELMQPVNMDLSPYSIQVICPGVHVSTAQAFQTVSPAPAAFDLKTFATLPVTEWEACISNDFEHPVFAIYPVLKEIKEQLYGQGAIYASMSGSGSALYGIFPKNKKATITAAIPFKEFYVE